MIVERLTAAQRLERRKAQRLEEILDVAARLFAQLGYEQTTADAIAAEVHLTKSALYTYVASKEEIAVRLLQMVIEQLLNEAEVIAGSPGTASERLRQLIVRHVVVLGHHPASSLLFLHSEHILSPETYPNLYESRDRYEGFVRRWIQEGMDTGEFAVHDAKIAGFLILGSLNWVIRWFSPKGPLSSEVIGEHYASMLIGGLTRPVTTRGHDGE